MSSSRFLATFLFASVVFAAGTQAAVFSRISQRAACPVVTTKPDFNYIPYAGLWYEIERFENVFQQGSTCIRAIYEEISPGVVSVLNTGVLSDGSLTNITGSATAISPEEPGHLIVSFPGRPDGDYLVLDTDYTNYASVYSCGLAGAFVLEYAWLLGREQTMTQEVMDVALSKFTQFGVDVSKFKPTAQGESCVYFPEYPFPPTN
ncbi:apolipoprotein D-like [Daphnia pulicaria]|uniref:apolipoprotein D-like n=1 Tax=Daphnia pulicaria TaxID=35523 RepID=UPI001EEBA49C|nr:apolipoprotein D-like [Daphnia pulicaria]